MELKQLEYFTIVCEKGSFSQAAECLYTSQPNVSKVISSLEKGVIAYRNGEATDKVAISSGFVEINDNHVVACVEL